MKCCFYNLGLLISLLGFTSVAMASHGHGGGGGGHHSGGMGGGHHMSAPSHHFSAPSHHMSAPSHHFSSPSVQHHHSAPSVNMNHSHHTPAGTFSGGVGTNQQHHHSGSTIANQIQNSHHHHGVGSIGSNQSASNHFHTPTFTNQHFHHHTGGAGNIGNSGNWSGHHTVSHHHHPSYWNNNSFFFGIGTPFGSYYGSRYGVGYGGFGYGGIGYGIGSGYGYYPYSNFGYGFGYGGGYGNYGYRPTMTYISGAAYGTPTNYLAGSSSALPGNGIIAASSAPAVVQTVAQALSSSTDSSNNATALDYAGRGEQNFKAGNYKQAAKDWRHALVEDPNNAAYVLLLGQALFATGEFDEAAGATQQAARALPQENWEIVVKNYRQLYGNIGDYTTQLRALEKARTEKSDSPALRFLLGWHYGYLGFPKEAVAELDKLLALAPTDEIGKKLRDQFAAKLPKTETTTPPAPTKEAGESKAEVEKKDV